MSFEKTSVTIILSLRKNQIPDELISKILVEHWLNRLNIFMVSQSENKKRLDECRLKNVNLDMKLQKTFVNIQYLDIISKETPGLDSIVDTKRTELINIADTLTWEKLKITHMIGNFEILYSNQEFSKIRAYIIKLADVINERDKYIKKIAMLKIMLIN